MIFLARGFARALRRGLSLVSGPDEKVASDFTSVPDPSERRCGRARPQREAISINPTNPHLHESVGYAISLSAFLVLIGQKLSL